MCFIGDMTALDAPFADRRVGAVLVDLLIIRDESLIGLDVFGEMGVSALKKNRSSCLFSKILPDLTTYPRTTFSSTVAVALCVMGSRARPSIATTLQNLKLP